MPIIEVSHVFKQFQDRAALNDVSLQVESGEMVCIAGPSGAGKTTLLKLMTRELLADRGSVLIDGVDLRKVPARQLPELRRQVAVVPQHGELLMNRTAGENITFALSVLGWERKSAVLRAGEMLEVVGLESRFSSRPMELSGGERQRVAIARALSVNPRVLLADEPTGNLDAAMTDSVLQALRATVELGCAVVVASHDTQILTKEGLRVVELKAGGLLQTAGAR